MVQAVVAGLPRTLREEPLLLVSPHPDDAAFSCAALLARLKPIDVLTVFAGSPDPPRQGAWDRVTGFVDSTESMPVRLAEERAAFAGGPHRLILLDVVDAQYLTGPRPPSDAKPIAAAVVDWLEHHPRGVVAAPAGAGRARQRLRTRVRRLVGADDPDTPTPHPDHLFVRDAVLDALESREDARPVLYEELPYLWGRAADREVERVVRGRGLTAEHVAVPVDRRAKAARIGVYATQAPHLDVRGRRVEYVEDLPERERFWLLRRAH